MHAYEAAHEMHIILIIKLFQLLPSNEENYQLNLKTLVFYFFFSFSFSFIKQIMMMFAEVPAVSVQ